MSEVPEPELIADHEHSPDLDREGECPCPACSAPAPSAESVAPEQVVQDAIDLWRLRYDPVVDGPTMSEAIVMALQEAGLL